MRANFLCRQTTRRKTREAKGNIPTDNQTTTRTNSTPILATMPGGINLFKNRRPGAGAALSQQSTDTAAAPTDGAAKTAATNNAVAPADASEGQTGDDNGFPSFDDRPNTGGSNGFYFSGIGAEEHHTGYDDGADNFGMANHLDGDYGVNLGEYIRWIFVCCV